MLDLGRQPPADWFPLVDADPAGDPAQALRMGLCRRCGLAQLLEDVDGVEEPRGIEPQALVDQAARGGGDDRGGRPGRRGRHGRRVRQPPRRQLASAARRRRLPTTSPTADGPAELVVDVFGLMHDADQRGRAGAARGPARRRRHAVAAVPRARQHPAAAAVERAAARARGVLRHVGVVVGMLAELGLTAFRAWTFELYGGTVLLAAARGAPAVDASLTALLDRDRELDLRAPEAFDALAAAAATDAADLVGWLIARRDEGRRVIGYGAASRAVPLLVHAGVDADLLPAIADGSPAKQGRRMPRSRVPIVAADVLAGGDADLVLLFVPDLLAEVRAAYPQVSARGGQWAVSEPRPRLVAP